MPKIKSIHVKEFKRFTDLQVNGFPESARLVVLIGPNGCGKTSLSEAFNAWDSIENYLWSDEILKELAATTSDPVQSEHLILQSKDKHLGRLSGTGDSPQDRVKDIVGLLYTDIHQQIGDLRGKGSSPQEFAKTTLVPLITPATTTYQELERDIFL